MSDPQNHSHTASDSAGLIKTPKQVLAVSVAAFVVPVFTIIGLALFATTQFKPQAGIEANNARAIAQRIARVGAVEIKDAAAPLASGEAVYQAQCAACHATGALGAPKFEDKAAWAKRASKGFTALQQSALEGKGQMPRQGGGDYDDLEIGRAVAYLANSAGARFAMPERAAPAAAPQAQK